MKVNLAAQTLSASVADANTVQQHLNLSSLKGLQQQ